LQVDSIKILNDKSSISSSSSHISLSSSGSPHVDIIKLVAAAAAGQSSNNSNSTFIKDYYQSSHLNTEESINQIIKSPPSIPHQHFHKRYLRETLKQQDEEKRQQHEQQLHIQNVQLSSYIIAKPQQSESRYIFGDELALSSYHNNNNSAQSNYESSNCEYDLSQKAIDYAMPKLNSTASSVASSLSSSPSPKQQQQKQHPNNIPYDPLVHTTSKPPYSFR
jgi:hypothetical protein